MYGNWIFLDEKNDYIEYENEKERDYVLISNDFLLKISEKKERNKKGGDFMFKHMLSNNANVYHHPITAHMIHAPPNEITEYIMNRLIVLYKLDVNQIQYEWEKIFRWKIC